MSDGEIPGPFTQLKAILKAWGATKKQVVEENEAISEEDRKKFLSHVSKLGDTDTLLMLGYVFRAEEKTGRGIVKAKIAETLVPMPPEDAPAEDREEAKSERHRIGQSLTRRGASLEFFSLVERVELTATAIEFLMTPAGRRAVEVFVERYFEELEKAKGGPVCLAAE